ncbi:hypothetical protein F5883DRAFT_173568 [Diaporthe sp. PMI_573]|nr:hypothetical protein F5883DRAFT_173568 [Diaporthaceae sp. PMI_573]
MERSHVSEETCPPTQTDPEPNHNLSPMRKLSQTTARFLRKMSLTVPSKPPGSPSLATGNAAPTGDPDHGHLQTTLPPGFAAPPGLPHPQVQPDTSGLRPPPGFPPLPPRGAVFGSEHSPPSRRPGGTHLENCHSLSKTRVVSRYSCVIVSTNLY